MNLSRYLPWVGASLLAVTFCIAGWNILGRETLARRDDVITIRFAHWQLEPGFREAMDRVARAYEARVPGVRIEQIAIPERIFPSWTRTQLIGGTAPDIIIIRTSIGDDILPRYFLPLSTDVNRPNPYNEGSPHEGAPWRSTFLDGLAGPATYNPTLLENYGIPMSMFTVRVFYNRDLWQSLLGDRPEPTTYAEMLAAGRDARAEAARRGRVIVSLAGSKYNAPLLMDRLFSSQTQRMTVEEAPYSNFRYTGRELGLDLLAGRRRFDAPPFDGAFAISREIAREMPPGFEQMGREDATFNFLQGKALMLMSGSWDVASLRNEAPFETGVFKLPFPARDDPVYGNNVLGDSSEAETGLAVGWGVTRLSSHPEQAVDFLRFFSSCEGNALFARSSGWLPVIVGLPAPPGLEDFAPVIEGFPGGLNSSLGSLGAETKRLYDTRLSALLRPDYDPVAFLAAYARDLRPALRADFNRAVRTQRNTLARQDLMLAAHYWNAANGTDPRAARKLVEMRENQTLREAEMRELESALAATAAP